MKNCMKYPLYRWWNNCKISWESLPTWCSHSHDKKFFLVQINTWRINVHVNWYPQKVWIYIRINVHMNWYPQKYEFIFSINSYSPAVVSMNHTSRYIDTRGIIPSVAIDTRTSILYLSFSKKSFLRPANSSSIFSGHSSLCLINSFLGRPLEQAYRPPFSWTT